ncbi:MAG: hypothetical protein MGF17_13715 [Trichodesmium sp. MAG_R04]|nr:hypothetical protein [Trichodesmium sp. MAG_R04]
MEVNNNDYDVCQLWDLSGNLLENYWHVNGIEASFIIAIVPGVFIAMPISAIMVGVFGLSHW